jgi:uncharacterized protein
MTAAVTALTVEGVSTVLRERLEGDLRAALAGRDLLRVSVLRATLSALSNAESVDPSLFDGSVTEAPRRELGEDDARLVVERERDELRTSANRLRRVGASERARELVTQARLLDGYVADARADAHT